jgi:pyruvate formate lyase activating enzyme
LQFVYVARVTGHEGENTFCPNCGEMVIDRVGFVIQEIRMEQGVCQICGAEIPGRWE